MTAAPERRPAPVPPPAHPRRIAFLGTPAIAVPTLEALHAAGFEIPVVVTGVDKRRGRGAATTPTPVKAAAEALGLQVAHDLDAALPADADLGVVFAYGQMIRRPVLERLPMVNLHVSLLPRWRGAAPIERAILEGDERTGVCLMGVDETLDTGDVYARAEVEIGPEETADELRARMAALAAEVAVRGLSEGLTDPVPQQGEVTYAAKITSEDLRIDWSAPATRTARQVRVGGAWTTWRGKRLKVWAIGVCDPGQADGASRAPGEFDGEATVRVGDGAIRLLEVQPEGRARVDAADWARGARPEPGETFL